MRITAFLHSDRFYMRELGLTNGLSNEAAENFSYALYQVEVELEVDEKTGSFEVTAVDGLALVPKT